MIEKFTMTVFAAGHTVGELEANALNRASVLTGWQGPIRLRGTYKVHVMPQGEYAKGAWPEEVETARQRGNTIWSDINVTGFDPSGIDLNPVLDEGLQAIADWEQATSGTPAEHAAMHAVTEALFVLHDVLSNGGKLPAAWKDAV